MILILIRVWPTIHLHEEFRLEPPAGLVFTVTAPLAANGVYLINKDSTGCIVTSLWVCVGGGGGRDMSTNHSSKGIQAVFSTAYIRSNRASV